MEKKESKAVETTAPHPNKIGIKEGIGYMLGDAGNLFVLTYVSSFLKVFYTDVLKIATDKVATLFLVSRLWDAVNDPMWGTIVAKRRPNKDGKYRSYLKWLAIPLALSQLVCFIDVRAITNKQWALLLFAYVTYIAFGMLYTGMNVPFGSLASVITDDPDGRTLLSTFRSIGGGIGGAAPLLLAPFIIYTKVKIPTDLHITLQIPTVCFGLARLWRRVRLYSIMPAMLTPKSVFPQRQSLRWI